jgi:hypothetical protein
MHRSSLLRIALAGAIIMCIVTLVLGFQHGFTAFAGGGVPESWMSPTPGATAPPTPKGRGSVETWPFQSHSPWNVPISKTAAYESSTSACSTGFHHISNTGGPGYVYMSAATDSHPVYAARSTDPWATIFWNPTITHKTGIAAVIRIPTNAEPAAASSSGSTDARIDVIDPAGRFVSEMWKAVKNKDGSWTVVGYDVNDIFGQGILQGGTRAYGGSNLGGLIRHGELNGSLQWPSQSSLIEHSITHAIAMAIPKQWQNNTWVWPSDSNDDDGTPNPIYQGVVPMGQFTAIPSSISITSLGLKTMQGVELGFALQNYGAYLVDSSSNYSYYAEPAAAGDIGQINHAINGATYSDLAILESKLVCVDHNTANSPGSGSFGAQRRVCWAPWLPSETPVANQCVYDRPTPLPPPQW